MDELTTLVMEKANLSEQKAEEVIDTVIGFLEKKLPEPLGGNLRGFMENEQAVDMVENTLGTLSKGVGEWFNKRKDQ